MQMSPRASTEQLLDDTEMHPHVEDCRASTGSDSSFGGSHKRRELEKRLLRKLDMRVAFLVIVFITNFVSLKTLVYGTLIGIPRWIDPISRESDLHKSTPEIA